MYRPITLAGAALLLASSVSACSSNTPTIEAKAKPPATASYAPDNIKAPLPREALAATTHDLLQFLPLLVGQSAYTDRLGHRASSGRIGRHGISNRQRRPTRRTYVVRALDVPDTPVNRAAFGGPVNNGQPAGFPQARVVTLTECGTHAQLDAAVGGFKGGAPELAITMADAAAGMLVIMDRGFPGVALWKDARGHGAVVHDHAHEQPPGRAPARRLQSADAPSGVNTPGRTWSAHPRCG